MNTPKNDKEALIMAVQMFGRKPSATEVLEAWLSSQPGPNYTGFIPDQVLLMAAKLALGATP